MKKLFILLWLLGGTIWLPADTPSDRVENRFLFVLETSASMDRASKAAQQTVRDLIESGLHGQMRPGDTFGLWTFNDRLDTSFPMQRWIPAENKKLAATAASFLKKRRNEKKAEMQSVLPPLFSVMKSSRAITVIFISTGNEPIQGTPFDREINSVYPHYARELREAKLPFVTIFVGRNGRMVAHAVNSALGPIQIPNPPIQPDPAPVTQKTNAPVVTNKVVAATNQIAPPRIAKTNIIITKSNVTTQPVAENAAAVSGSDEIARKESTSAAGEIANVTAKVPDSRPQETQPTSAAVSPKVEFEDPTVFKPQTQELVGKNLPKPSISRRPDGSHNTAPDFGAVTATQKEVLNPQTPAPIVATQHATGSKKFMAIGILLLVIASVLIFFVVRSSRSKSQPSIISRSIDGRK